MKEDRWRVTGLVDRYGYGDVKAVHEIFPNCEVNLTVSMEMIQRLFRCKERPLFVTLRQLRGLDPLI